ncbi:PilN domain-containing protein [Neisseria chenwenguii]|uniref:Pilus assembly protein PilP n=1 Tax=Neisseria chenwenguii TaxID=1853278 RepID=A0A220S0E2_9NEIS|nr:PilN domain-containing protein [Neisseria chenwenguii]ASK26836.1 pilus assembly protein PilP [Neisseria chenwenguii]ROV56814.1 pilus assembly protein PilP [Neisseria chenwenguii]
MIELTKINLLPYREEIKQRKKQQFKVMMLAALLAGLGLSVLAYLGIENAVSSQQGRNSFLESEIAKLDKDLGEIQKLQQEKENFLAKKLKVEELQEKRSQAAYIIDTLNVLTPDNTYLTAIEAESPTSYKVTGHAASDNKIAMLMRSLPSTGVFAQPELLSIKKVDNYQEFTLKVLLTQNITPAPAAATATPAAPAAASAAATQEQEK